VYRCAGCFDKRRLVHPALKSCKGRRLCSVIDTDLARLAIEHGIAGSRSALTFARLTQRVQVGYFGAEILASYSSYPKTFDEFLNLLCSMHRLAFGAARFPFAGAFREGDKAVWFGSGANELQGAATPEILPRLGRLFAGVFANLESMSQERFAYACAIFLEAFFRIHPFRIRPANRVLPWREKAT
jgi:hypothetical protein